MIRSYLLDGKLGSIPFHLAAHLQHLNDSHVTRYRVIDRFISQLLSHVLAAHEYPVWQMFTL